MVTPPDARSDPQEAFYIGEMVRGGNSLVMVAEADGGVVANLILAREPGGMQDHMAVLSICVDHDWRDAGIGSALVRAAQEWATAQRLQKIALSVFPDNARAVAVYEKAGFVREGVRRMQYRAPGGGFRDELLMAWFAPESPDARDR
jgi:ribosomal protein S18 acetylase RimI-like enzyme